MKTTLLLQTLKTQFGRLEAEVAPLAGHATVSARFDKQLFHGNSLYLADCLKEAQENLQALQSAVDKKQQPQVAWLSQHLVAQLEAIARESATWSLRAWDSGSPALTRWQRKRLQHQEYERRLLAMKQEREQQLRLADTLSEQQRLTREIEAFEGRLTRCRNALQGIEKVLAQMTR